MQKVDNNKIIVSNKISFGKEGFKYFIGYNDSKKVRPLCTILRKLSAYRRNFDETKYMSFMIENGELLQNYDRIVSKKDLIMNQYNK